MRMIVKFGVPVVGLAAAFLLGTAPALHAVQSGCMAERYEYDILFDDKWHGGDAEPPTTGCGGGGEGGECEWGMPFNHQNVTNAHSNWDPGSLSSGGHTWVSGGSCSSDV